MKKFFNSWAFRAKHTRRNPKTPLLSQIEREIESGYVLLSFLKSSLLRLRWRAQSAMLVQASESGLDSGVSPMISIRSRRSEKLLSLKAKAKSASVDGVTVCAKSESMTVLLGSKRSVLFKSFIMRKNQHNHTGRWSRHRVRGLGNDDGSELRKRKKKKRKRRRRRRGSESRRDYNHHHQHNNWSGRRRRPSSLLTPFCVCELLWFLFVTATPNFSLFLGLLPSVTWIF